MKIYEPGQKLRDVNYGPGVVLEADAEYTSIRFRRFGVKKFITSMLKMEPIEEPKPAPPPPSKRAAAAPTKSAPAGRAARGPAKKRPSPAHKPAKAKPAPRASRRHPSRHRGTARPRRKR